MYISAVWPSSPGELGSARWPVWTYLVVGLHQEFVNVRGLAGSGEECPGPASQVAEYGRAVGCFWRVSGVSALGFQALLGVATVSLVDTPMLSLSRDTAHT